MHAPAYLNIALWLLLASAPLAAAAKTWQFEKNRDPLGTGYVVMANADLEAVTPMVRCWTEEAAMDVRFALNARYRLSDASKVALRFDEGTAQVVRWPRNAGGHALIVPAAAQQQLLSNLRAGRQLQLILTLGTGYEQTLQIPLDGSSRAISQVLAGCS
ncbi:MAG: hypothetical protein ACR2PZ_25270 [Pseudomonadales bacterium]